MWTGGMSPPFSFVTSPKCAIPGKWRFVMEIGAFSISLAHAGTIPQRTAASGNTPIPSNRLPSRISFISAAALTLYGQDAVQRGCRDPQPLGHGHIVFHAFRGDTAAHHQHMRAAEQVTAHVDATFMLLGNGVVQEKRLIERGADGRKARLIDSAAILGGLLRRLAGIAAPRGGDIRKGSFHFENLHFYNVVGQPFSPALFQSWKRGRLWRIYPRRLPEKKHSRGRRSRARPPHTAGRSPLDSPLPPVLDYGRRRGI